MQVIGVDMIAITMIVKATAIIEKLAKLVGR